MAKRKMRCFLIYKIEKRYRRNISRPYKLEGQQATVHATSKTAAIELLKGFLPGQRFKVIANQNCDPLLLIAGDHCINNLIVKDSSDPTPLGFIKPHSPEWTRRVENALPKISKRRQAIIDEMQKKRKDLYG